MWYCCVVERNVGLATVALVALVLVDIMIIVHLMATVDLVVAVRTKAAGVGVGPGRSDLGLPGQRARLSCSQSPASMKCTCITLKTALREFLQ